MSASADKDVPLVVFADDHEVCDQQIRALQYELALIVSDLNAPIARLLRNPCEHDDAHEQLVHREAVNLMLVRDRLQVALRLRITRDLPPGGSDV